MAGAILCQTCPLLVDLAPKAELTSAFTSSQTMPVLFSTKVSSAEKGTSQPGLVGYWSELRLRLSSLSLTSP